MPTENFLLTSEYAITQGAKGLALPARFGQKIHYLPNLEGNSIFWSSLDHDAQEWFRAEISLSLEVLSTSNEKVAAFTQEPSNCQESFIPFRQTRELQN